MVQTVLHCSQIDKIFPPDTKSGIEYPVNLWSQSDKDAGMNQAKLFIDQKRGGNMIASGKRHKLAWQTWYNIPSLTLISAFCRNFFR